MILWKTSVKLKCGQKSVLLILIPEAKFFYNLPEGNFIESESEFTTEVSRPVCPGIKHPSGAYDQIFITFWQLRFWFCGAPSLTRWRVCLLRMLLALPSAVLPGSESLCSRDHILLSQIWDFPFRSLLRLAGSRWRYSTTPPHWFNFVNYHLF
jgi:hypothetical protein